VIYKLEEYITEKLVSDYVKELTVEDFMKYMDSDDYDMFPDADPIFRQINIGFNTYGDFNIIDPKTITRRSPNSMNNYTNLLASNLPSWKSYPKRNKSLICGDFNRTSKHFQMGEENLFIVIPKTGSKIGMCADDFWDSFNFGELSDFGRNIKKQIGAGYDDDWSGFKKAIKKIDFDELKVNYSFDETKSVYQNINEMMNPRNNKFLLKKWDNNFKYDYRFFNVQEVWTDSTSLLIRYKTSKELKII